MSEKLPRVLLSPPHMCGEEQKFVAEVFETNWVAPAGPQIDAFESELATYAGVSNCAAVSSGTAAIHLALIIIGVEKGDDVICSTFTFSGSCNPVVYQGATPVFVDSDQETWNMDPELLEHAILKRKQETGKVPKAIIVVHLYGMPAKIDRIMEIARRHQIVVIEDAAEALGSKYLGKKLGCFGDIGIYSFNGNKIITTSGGGAMVSENKDWITEARFLATQARDPAPHYQHSKIGYNYRLSNVCAAIGRGQLTVIDQRVAQRRANFDGYRGALAGLPLRFLEEGQGAYSNRWLTTILLEDTDNQSINRTTLQQALEGINVESRPLWKPMHLQPVFKGAPAYVNGTSEKLFERGLCLPSGSALSTVDRGRICTAVRGHFTVTKGPFLA